jgi:hypothetical protein
LERGEAVARSELFRALEIAIGALLREATEVADAAAKLEPQLRELTSISRLQ